MIVTLRTERIRTLEQVRAFLDGNEAADFVLADRDSAYVLVRRTLERFGYHHRPGRSDKGLLRAYLAKVTGLSRAQLTRLIARHRRTGDIRDRRRKPPANAFQRRYTPRDVALLAEVDAAYGRLSGPATKEILRRQYEVHHDGRFERLARISNGYIHNLRARRDYRLGALSLDKTGPVQVSIGVRRRPDPQGRPGFVRVDYRQQDVATPYEKLKSLPDAENFLRDGVTFEQLDKTAAATSGLEAAKAVRVARRQLFRDLPDAGTSAA